MALKIELAQLSLLVYATEFPKKLPFRRVRNLIAKRLEDLSPLLGRLGQGAARSRDFH